MRFILPALLASLLAASAAPARRPNLVWIVPDQLRSDSLGFSGNRDVQSPHIDRLASEGLTFRNMYANTPVCCPARASMLTGRYASTHGLTANDLRLRETEVTLAEILATNNYQTAFIGKWHLDGGKREPGFVPPGPRRQGFQFWAAHECRHTHFAPVYFRDDPRPIADSRFEPEVWTDLALEFLQKRDAGRPFFLCIFMGPPHDPYGAPADYMKRYDPARLTMRANWKPDSPGGSRADIAAYYAAITAIDDQVGRLMGALEAAGVDRETMVFLTSDHGDMLGSHGMRLKRKPHEESSHIPGILRYPARVKAGRATQAFFTHADMAPTFLALCGITPPAAMQGNNLAPLISGKRATGPNSAFLQMFTPFRADSVTEPWRGIVMDRYTYARTEAGPWLLFDNHLDPFQTNNLAGFGNYRAVQKKMERELVGWMDRTGDSWSVNCPEFIEGTGGLTHGRAFYSTAEYLDWTVDHPEFRPPKRQ